MHTTPKETQLAHRQHTASGLWRDALTSLTNALVSWRVMALGLLAINASLALALIWMNTQVKLVAFVDVVDPQNRVLWSGPAASYRPDDLWIGNTLMEWLIDIRSRPGNIRKPEHLAVLNSRWKKAYDLTDGEAAKALATYIAEENPLKQRESIEVSVTIEAISRYRPGAGEQAKITVYHMEWSEEWKVGGFVRARPRFTGDFWTELRPEARQAQTTVMTQGNTDRGKPGLFVMKFQWSQKLEGAAS